MRTSAEALAWIREVGIATSAAHVEGVACFVEAVTGERIKGSWWGHPQGKLIFRLGEALDDATEVVSLKLLEGKATLVHTQLWPALLAVVLDEAWRTARAKKLPAAARAFWRNVEKASVRGGPAPAVKALEDSLLVHCASEHTEKGRHEKRLTGWSEWARVRQVKASPGGFKAGLEILQARAGGNPTGLSLD